MKLLIINENKNVQTKWVEPLRKEGWGVMCVRSVSEAEQVLQFHGASLDALVLHREQAGQDPSQAIQWLEQLKGHALYSIIPTVIVSGKWSEQEILKHQKTPFSSNAYLNENVSAEQFKQSIYGLSSSSGSTQNLKQANGFETSQVLFSEKTLAHISLEDVSDVLIKRTEKKAAVSGSDRTSVILAPPTVFLGGKTSLEVNAVMATAEENKTIILDVTKMEEYGSPVIPHHEETLEEIEIVQEEPSFIAPVQAQVPAQPVTSFRQPEEVIQHTTSTQSFQAQPLPAMAIMGSSSSDLDTLKNYLSMREQDVAVLTGQVRSVQERIHHLEVQLKIERARAIELQHLVQKQELVIKNYDLEKQVELDVLYKQVEDLNLRLGERTDKVRLIESKLKVSTDEVDKIKERVRIDIRRIRVREKELEGQLEVLKKDSSALLMARDEKIVELKRRLDLLEFNMELVQEQYSKERSSTEQLRQRLKDASTAMKQAGGLLDHEN